MTDTMKRALASVDRDALQREAEELRDQLKNYDDLLALIDRIGISGAGAMATLSTNGSSHDKPSITPTNGNGHHKHGRKSLSEKRELVLAILRERPGRWTTSDMRDALRERGIDPDAGTPVKNILWNLAKAGEVHGSGGGVYEFPALNVSVEPPQEVLAA